MKLDSLKKESIQDIRKKFSSFFLKVGWILMFVGTPIGSGIGALPFLLAGNLLKKRLSLGKNPMFFLINVFILISLISIINAKNKLFTIGSVILIALMFYLIFFGVEYIILRKDFLRGLVKIFIICSVFSSIYGLVIYFGGFGERARTLFTGENGLGTVMIPAVVGTLAFFAHTSDKEKLLSGIALPIILMGLLFSFSRGAWLGAVGGLFAYGVFQRKDRFKVAVLLAIMIAILFAFHPLLSRLSSIPDLSYPSNKERIYILEATLKMIKAHPWIGVGMGNYALVYPEYKVGESKIFQASFAHNIFLQIWAECGVGAMFVFMIIVILTLLKGVKIAKSDNPFPKAIGSVSLASFVGILIHNQVDCTVYSVHIGSFFLLLAGIIFYGEKLALKIKDKIQENAK